jgi:hypothetical protein
MLCVAQSKREWAMYEVTTQTGKVSGGGTTAQCYITFRGEHGDYGPCQLERPSDDGSVLKEGAKDVFDVCALDVGSLKAVVISHDNTGESPSWHLTAVTVRRARTDTQEAKTFEFYYDGWVSAEKGEQSLRVEIGLSSRQAKGGQVRGLYPANPFDCSLCRMSGMPMFYAFGIMGSMQMGRLKRVPEDCSLPTTLTRSPRKILITGPFTCSRSVAGSKEICA